MFDWGELHLEIGGEASAAVRNLLQEAGAAFPDQPEILFGIAGALALLLGLWSDAERFAELALRSSSTADNEHSSDEFSYLSALARRFRIGEAGPVKGEGPRTGARRQYREAKRLLDICAARIRGSDPSALVKRIRLHSERAALNLFYFATVMLSSDPRLRQRFSQSDEAASVICAAESDLQVCMALDTTPDGLGEGEAAAMRRIRRQYVANIAAAHVLRAMCGPSPSESSPLIAPDVVETVRNLLGADPRLPAISRLDMLAYLASADPARAELLAEARRLAAQFGNDPALPLDAATALAIGAWLAAGMPRGDPGAWQKAVSRPH